MASGQKQSGIRRATSCMNYATAATQAKRVHSVRAGDLARLSDVENEINRIKAELDQRISILEMAPDGIIIVDESGTITFANSQATKLFNYNRGELIGKPIETLIPPRFSDVHVNHRKNYTSDPHTRPMGIGLDLYGLRKDGSEFPVEIALSPIRTNGQLTVTAIVRDVTDRKHAEEEIKRLNTNLEQRIAARTAQLEAANKELEAFSYSVSHDLSAPLRLVDGFSRDLAKDYKHLLDEKGQQDITWIRQATDKMARLIDDLLRLSRISRSELRLRDVNLSTLAHSIAADIRKQDPDRQVTFEIQPGIMAHTDSSLISIAIENLFGNSWKFTSKTPNARLEFGVQQQQENRVYFVRDNGAGFEMTYSDRLFTPFERLHTESEFPGTGIGLAIVRRIINRLHGRVWAVGQVGKGATIYFTLGSGEESQ